MRLGDINKIILSEQQSNWRFTGECTPNEHGRVRKLVGDFKENENLKNGFFGINLVKVISLRWKFAFVLVSGFKSL